MAYQAKGRDPIFDSTTQALIERRGKELIGLALIAAAIAFAMLIGSYSPNDPGLLAATEGPTQNLLGPLGAAIASPLAVIIGKAAWGLVIALAAWGLRFVTHIGEERALGRAVFVPIAIALGAVYASTLVPGPDWSLTFGLGGLFGDTVLGALLAMFPGGAAFGLKALTLVFGPAMLVAAGFALGINLREIRNLTGYMLGGIVLFYAGALKLTGRGMKGAARGALTGTASGFRVLKARQAERRADRVARAEAAAEADWDDGLAAFAAPPPLPQTSRVNRAEPPMSRAAAQEEAWDEPGATQPRPGLLARVSGLARRAADPAPAALSEAARYAGAQSSDRISDKIASALRARSGDTGINDVEDRQMSPMSAAIARARARQAEGLRGEPPVTRAEPPVTAALQTELYDEPLADPLTEPMWDDGDIEPDYAADYEADYIPQPAPAPRMAPVPVPEAKKVVQHATRKVAPSSRAQAEAQPRLNFGDGAETYELPPLSLLADPGVVERQHLSDEALEENARMLETVLDDYGVKGEIVSVRPGPVVTMYELEPAPGLKASRVIGLADDIARSMSALSARVSTVPGRSVIGIELPNAHREKVVLREILSARDYGDSNMRLPLALGKDIGGAPIIANLAKMPHLLIAGTTGSGKSVAINTMILSLLYRLTPEDCRLIMIDPKMLELSVYDGIPHLLSPVVTDPKKAVVALKWVVGEMEERYRKMSKMGVRNIEGFNGRVKEALDKGEMFSRTVQTGFDEETGEPIFETEKFAPEKLPYIVVVVDEMADLMMVAGKEIEAAIQRLAQMARASGIHIIMATQRPSVDVITGTI
ncbi:MAG: DNA translocase FtsK, partial [Maritimibacter sp.]|nr:DNA translocase FtsK [Maritimibacter sp.]